jgi:hypothetical protein
MGFVGLHSFLVCAGYLGWVPYDWLYQTRWYSLAGAAIIGLIYSLWIVAPYPSTGKKLLADFFLDALRIHSISTKGQMQKCGFI